MRFSTFSLLLSVASVTSALAIPSTQHARDASTDTNIWLMDTTAYQSGGKWQAELTSAFFAPAGTGLISNVMSQLADVMGGSKGDQISLRIKPVTEKVKHGQTAEVSWGSGKVTAGPSDADGIAVNQLSFASGQDGETAQLTANGASIKGEVHFAAPNGWVVVSDIDDTVKHTMTKDGVRGILKSTFVDTPTPISGMPELYKTIQSAVSPTWFFVSASPYNLFPFLRRFLHRYYPAGTIMLRSQSWQDPEGLISMMTESVLDFKVSHITKIHSWLPERKAICVGDSTQFDPEVYATIYRNNPGWVRQIFIRNVTDIGLGQDKNGAARFEEAFQGVPQAVWKVFEDPEELRAAVAALTGGE